MNLSMKAYPLFDYVNYDKKYLKASSNFPISYYLISFYSKYGFLKNFSVSGKFIFCLI
jgi:hypothetical protein